jgi:phosphoribosyl 1,2-cyclic phosphate phosphodiesterase
LGKVSSSFAKISITWITVTPIEVINNESFVLGGKEITPINVMHGCLQVFGYRIESFAYLTDVKTIDNQELDKLKNLDVLVINALREEHHNTHFNLQEALDFIALVQPKKAYLTHISYHLGFHDEVQNKLPDTIHLAYDNLEINLL